MKTGCHAQVSITGEQYLAKQRDCSGYKHSGEIACNIHFQEKKIQAVAWTEFWQSVWFPERIFLHKD